MGFSHARREEKKKRRTRTYDAGNVSKRFELLSLNRTPGRRNLLFFSRSARARTRTLGQRRSSPPRLLPNLRSYMECIRVCVSDLGRVNSSQVKSLQIHFLKTQNSTLAGWSLRALVAKKKKKKITQQTSYARS